MFSATGYRPRYILPPGKALKNNSTVNARLAASKVIIHLHSWEQDGWKTLMPDFKREVAAPRAKADHSALDISPPPK